MCNSYGGLNHIKHQHLESYTSRRQPLVSTKKLELFPEQCDIIYVTSTHPFHPCDPSQLNTGLRSLFFELQGAHSCLDVCVTLIIEQDLSSVLSFSVCLECPQQNVHNKNHEEQK